MPESLSAQLVDGIAAQDVAAIASCFAEDVQFRALIPPGLRERSGASDTAELIAKWFGDSTELALVDSHAEDVGDKLHVSYRFEGVEEGEAFVVEQQLYCTLENGKIAKADLVCSGFRPRPPG